MLRNFFQDKEFTRTMFKLAFPLMLQQVLQSSLSFIDMVMIGQLGDIPVAGIGLGNQVFFLVHLLSFGIGSATAMFTAQFWGSRDIESIRKSLGIGLVLSAAGGFLFSIVAILIPEEVLGIYSTDAAVVLAGSEYLRIVGLSFVFSSTAFIFIAVLRSVGNVRLPMAVSVLALGLNTLLNYALIFGNFGFPALGVRGAGIATCIALLLEFICMIAAVYLFRTPIAAKFSEIFSFDRLFLKKFLRTAIPVIVSEMLWAFGTTIYYVVYARIGTQAIVAINISASIEQLGFVIFIGLAHACAIMVGNRIGAKETGKAFQYALNFIVIGLAGSVVMSILIVLITSPVLNLYKISSVSREYVGNILRIFAFILWLRASNIIIFIGILRSGGDTRFAFIADAIAVWLIGIPLAFLGGFVLHLQIHWVYLLIMSEELIKFIVVMRRFLSKKWINDLTQIG
ncbi:MAG: MATE family efflux transporter [Anaerolineaceae bacterium]|nr:MATE family efflux transporter [Anaerolineaceae bacterium]